jgi:hypothetical protein
MGRIRLGHGTATDTTINKGGEQSSDIFTIARRRTTHHQQRRHRRGFDSGTGTAIGTAISSAGSESSVRRHNDNHRFWAAALRSSAPAVPISAHWSPARSSTTAMPIVPRCSPACRPFKRVARRLATPSAENMICVIRRHGVGVTFASIGNVDLVQPHG